MNCSWCDKKLQFFRALTGSLYCCDEHQSEEREHLKQLAIERLGKPAGRDSGSALGWEAFVLR